MISNFSINLNLYNSEDEKMGNTLCNTMSKDVPLCIQQSTYIINAVSNNDVGLIKT